MIMGNSYSEEKKKEWININRVTRQEQYDWFRTLRDADEGDIVQIIKTSPQMATTVMYFDTYYKKNVSCSCASDIEQVVMPSETRKTQIIKRIEKSVATGVCPHILLEQEGDIIENFILKVSDEGLDEVFSRYGGEFDTETSEISSGLGCGLYWIHLCILFRRIRVIQETLPVLRDFHFPSFVWYTIPNWFSPLYLAVLSEEKELSELLCRYNPGFLQDKLRIEAPNAHTNQSKAETMIERIASLDRVEALKTLFSISSFRNKKLMQKTINGAISTRAFSCINYLMEKGIKLDELSLKTEFNNAVYQDDVELINALLKFHDMKVSSFALKSAVRKGNVDMVKTLLQYIQPLRENSKYYSEFSACLTEAVLVNSEEIVQLLIQKNFNVNVCFRNISVLRWANIFKFTEIEELLQSNGANSFQENDSITQCVFNLVLNINQRNDHLVRRLLQLGTDVNDTRDGTPPFYTTMQLRRYDIMQALLLSGADPYIQPETWKYFLIRQTAENWRLLVHVFVSANASLSCDVRFSMLEYMCSANSTFFKGGDMVLLIVLSAHTITEKDKEILKTHIDTWNNLTLKAEIENHLYTPKPLSIICRNAIRRKFGQSLHKFIHIMKGNIPTKFVNLLQCTDVLEQFFTPYDRRKFTTEFVNGLYQENEDLNPGLE